MFALSLPLLLSLSLSLPFDNESLFWISSGAEKSKIKVAAGPCCFWMFLTLTDIWVVSSFPLFVHFVHILFHFVMQNHQAEA